MTPEAMHEARERLIRYFLQDFRSNGMIATFNPAEMMLDGYRTTGGISKETIEFAVREAMQAAAYRLDPPKVIKEFGWSYETTGDGEELSCFWGSLE